jgi:uroporphyrinogen-III synthase
MRLLVTRPQPEAERTATRLRGLGHIVIVAPVLAVRPSGEPAPPGPFDALLVTSANAVPAVARAGLAGPVFAVGPRTAAALRDAGFAEVRAAADALALAGLVRTELAAGARLLHVAGRDRKAEPERSLAAAGFTVTTWVAYAALPASALPDEAVRALARGDVDAVLHYSRRSAATLLDLAVAAGLDGSLTALAHVCISDDAAAPLRAAGARRVVAAAQPDEDGLLAALARLA